jgi:hypothetical protein
MIELNADRNIRETPHVADQVGECGLALVRVETQALRRDPSYRADGCGLHNHEARTGDSKVAYMHPVPGLRRSFDGAVLAQRRNHNAIFQS